MPPWPGTLQRFPTVGRESVLFVVCLLHKPSFNIQEYYVAVKSALRGGPLHDRFGPLRAGTKKAAPEGAAFRNKILAVSYSHMGRPHTTIGAERFHFRVRNGIGWFPLAIAARKTGLGDKKVSTTFYKGVELHSRWRIKVADTLIAPGISTIWKISDAFCRITCHVQNALALYDQASRAISTG